MAAFDLSAAGSADAPTRLLLDCVDQAILVLTDAGEIRYANSTARRMLSPGDDTATTAQLDAAALIASDDLRLAISRVAEHGRATVRVRPVPGGQQFELSMIDHRSTSGIDGIVTTCRSLEHEDVLDARVEQHRQEAEYLLSALTDELTGLPTRRLFLERLGHRLRARASGQTLSVLFIDLDGFKAINDALGHTAGDSMLRSTAGRLLSVVPATEQWGRVGGDEFVVFVEDCPLERAEAIAESIAGSLRQSIVLGGRTLHTSASIGLMLIETDVDAETALRRADIAMIEGKRTGPDTRTVFTAEMERHAVIRAELEGQLRSTLTGSGPDVVFQPIVDLRSGRTIAVEALARWHSPTHGPIGPDRFVAMAESMGLIGQLDRHVLRKACRSMVGQCEPNSGWPLDVTVNSSTMSLCGSDDAESMLQIMADEGFAPNRLILEVTESIAIENDAVLRDQLELLRAQGVRVAIDDFGTGHSSLAQLETLPVDFVKMDRSFLDDVPSSKRRMRYLETIIAMANALRLEVIFEGIEDPAQAHVLAHMGVELGQGYLLAEPIAAAHIQTWMERAQHTVLATISDEGSWQPVLEWTQAED